MNLYRADLHIHTALSPCGSLDMSPRNLLEAAAEKGLDIIGITDHNSTLQAPVIREMAKAYGIFVINGAEITSVEEVHCLCLVSHENIKALQNYIDKYIMKTPNNPEKLGHQPLVDQDAQILRLVPHSLHGALNQSISQIQATVAQMKGIFIPAHIDRPMFSIMSQLGFIPQDLPFDALEMCRHTPAQSLWKKQPHLKNKSFIRSSDAHQPQDVGAAYTLLKMHHRSFEEVKKCLNCLNDRKPIIT